MAAAEWVAEQEQTLEERRAKGRKARPRLRRFGSRVLLIVGSVALTLLVVDLALHALGYWPDLTGAHFLRNPHRVANADVIMIRPEFLDDAYFAADESDARIVALGDSFTEGFPVALQDAYPAVLERILQGNGRDVRVLNMGMGDSGPEQHLRLLERYVFPHFTPDVVVWTFYPNDLGDVLRYGVHDVTDGALIPLDASAHWIHRRQEVYDALPLPRWLKRRSAIVRAAMHAFESAHRPRMALTEATLPRAAERVRLTVRAMERLAGVHGFRVVYAFLAPQYRYLRALGALDARAPDSIDAYTALHSLLTAEVPVLDVYFEDAVQAARDGDPRHAPPGLGLFVDARRDRAPEGEHHFSEAGYRRLAERMAAHVDDGKALR